VKFTAGGDNVTVSAERIDGGVRLEGTDTGPGIARDRIDLMFEEFRQAGGHLSPPLIRRRPPGTLADE
jgi:signal transduction histidine kinase